MKLKTYPNISRVGDLSSEGSYSANEIRLGIHWIHTDVTCPHCGKEQPVAVTGYIGGPCVRCGELTSGKISTQQHPEG